VAFGEAQLLISDTRGIPLTPRQVARLYGKVIGLAGFFSFYYYFKWSIIRQFIDFNAKHTLEVGAGTGVFTFEVAKRLQVGSKIIGLDLDEHSVGIANEIVRSGHFKNVEFVQRDLRSLQLEEKFDQVLAFDVLEHIDDDMLALSQMNSVLEPNGLLVLTIPTLLFPKCFGKAWAEAIGHLRDGYSIEEIRAKLEMNGFRLLRYGYYGKYQISRLFVYLSILLNPHIPSTRLNIPAEWFLPIPRYLCLFFDKPSNDPRSICLAVLAQKV